MFSLSILSAREVICPFKDENKTLEVCRFGLQHAMITCTFRARDLKTKNCLSRTHKVPQKYAQKVHSHSPLWKRVIAWERSRAASGYGIIWGDADRNKQGDFSAECHSVDCF